MSLSSTTHDVHLIVFWTCGFIAVLVFAATIYFTFTHRNLQEKAGANFHKNHTTELVWTAIPFIILVLMAIPATKTLLDSEKERGSEIRLIVTGNNCNWSYDYLDYDISILSNAGRGTPEITIEGVKPDLAGNDKPIVLPVQTKIHLIFISIDRPYPWSVEGIDITQEILPGVTTSRRVEIMVPGVYRGLPVTVCGPESGFMPITLIATTKHEYNEWINRQEAPRPMKDQGTRR
ncbi:MAG TPA: hypothetical protein DGR97_08175 [Gammaproteobacteria bacterium]|nr:hypothetical protein [Gammaproteobacteria bacterium]|tara:strand:- start:208 stop:909 length:702 start_codon:yes stop_codon:yes gene_type:complete